MNIGPTKMDSGQNIPTDNPVFSLDIGDIFNNSDVKMVLLDETDVPDSKSIHLKDAINENSAETSPKPQAINADETQSGQKNKI